MIKASQEIKDIEVWLLKKISCQNYSSHFPKAWSIELKEQIFQTLVCFHEI